MFQLDGYEILEPLQESIRFALFRAGKLDDGRSVVVKTTRDDFPPPTLRDHLFHSYQRANRNKASCIPEHIEFIDNPRRPALVMEDCASSSLRSHLSTEKRSVEWVLKVGMEISSALMELHESGFIHCRLSPEHILWDPIEERIWLVGTGNSRRLEELISLSTPTEFPAESLPYISPEHTGRIGRSLDQRSDLYALGLVLYECLLGSNPFTATDSAGWLHCHLSHPPRDPMLGRPDLPPILTQLLLRLIKKDPERRYQSAFGLKHDLTRCQEGLARDQEIEPFELGRNDIISVLSIPTKLYGRKEQRDILNEALDRGVSGTKDSIFVSGYAGVGKSMLVESLRGPTLNHGGLFANGKFDQLHEKRPYSAIAEALGGLIRQVLGGKEEQLSAWKGRIESALGKNAQVLADIVPEIESLLGTQSPVSPLEPAEALNRFELVFQDFLGVFSGSGQVLVLFLDDLQWADSASLRLIELLVQSQTAHHFLLVGAYRGHEVDESHPLAALFDRLASTDLEFTQIDLQPLELSDVSELIAETLSQTVDQVAELSRLVHRKTNGNPFFLRQFLWQLDDEEMLKCDRQGDQDHSWRWDMQRIEDLEVTPNVLDFLSKRLSHKPATSRTILSVASCLGTTFDIRDLALVTGMDTDQLNSEIDTLITERLLVTKWIQETRGRGSELRYGFVHDRIQQAAYGLMNQEVRQQTHLDIARSLWEGYRAQESDERLFDITNNFNAAQSLVTDLEERKRVVELNRFSGRRARASAAFGLAQSFFSRAVSNLPDDAWTTDYRGTFDLFLDKAETEYLTELWDDATSTLESAQTMAGSRADKATINRHLASMYRNKNELQTALDLALAALAELGIELQPFPDEEDVRGEISAFLSLVEGRDPKDLFDLPMQSDPEQLVASALLYECFAPAFLLGSRLVSVIGPRIARISIETGNSPYSSLGYIFLSAITLANDLRDYDRAYAFGKLAVRLHDERFPDTGHGACILDMWGTFVCHHKDPIATARGHLLRGFHDGVTNGSYQWGVYSGIIDIMMGLWGPGTLDKLSALIETILPLGAKVEPHVSQWGFAIKATAHNLVEPSEDYDRFSEIIWPQAEAFHETRDVSTNLVMVSCKLALSNWFGEISRAAEYANVGHEFLKGTPGVYFNTVFRFHEALAYGRAYSSASLEKQAIYLDRIEEAAKLFRTLSDHNPNTYVHQYYAIEAEFQRISDSFSAAEILYDKAIEVARAEGFIQDEALICELASQAWLSQGRPRFSGIYLREAYDAYNRWGARAICSALAKKSLSILEPQRSSPTRGSQPIHARSSTGEWDLVSLLKASCAISEEIDLSELTGKLVSIIMENAGATRCLLFLNGESDLEIAAVGRINDEGNLVIGVDVPIPGGSRSRSPTGERFDPSDESFVLPKDLARQVHRTGTLFCAPNESLGNKDPLVERVLASGIRSILCTPLVVQGESLGVLYLDNELLKNVFGVERAEVIDVLASQAATSLETAFLFEERRCVEAELKRSHDDLLRSQEHARLGHWHLNLSTMEITGSPEMLRIFGFQGPPPPLERLLEIVHPEDREYDRRHIESGISDGLPWNIEHRLLLPDGEVRWVQASGTPEFDEGGKTIALVGVIQDITERKLAEEEREDLLRRINQMQRMESIGTLAGGVAHDFNNILGAIIGFAEISLGDVPPDGRIARNLEQILQSGDRAKDLVEQILNFSRDIPSERISQHLHPVVTEVVSLMRASLPATIELRSSIADDTEPVLADATQIHEILMNICTNAKQAMPDEKGLLEIAYTETNLDKEMVGRAGMVPPGMYSVITVRDNGCGMDDHTLSHLFEPFFTTKPLGEGTGMGLAVLYGLIQSHEGTVTVESTPGTGTTFKVFLPKSTEDRIEESPPDTPLEGGSERIMVVDDEETISSLVERMLGGIGYAVSTFNDSTQALSAFKDSPQSFDLVISDQTMPHLTGVELAEKIREIRSDVPFIISSGFSRQVDEESALAAGIDGYLQKPFRLGDIARKVRSVLLGNGDS